MNYDDGGVHYPTILNHFTQYLSTIPDAQDELKKRFQSLLTTTERSYSHLQRLITRTSDLNASILSLNTQLKQAMSISQEENNTVIALKKDIDRVWKQVEQSKGREEEARQKLEMLKERIDAIQSDMERGCPSGDRAAEIEKLKEKSTFLGKKYENHIQLKNALINENTQLEETISSLQRQHSRLMKQTQQYNDHKREMQNQTAEIAKMRRQCEKELHDYKEKIETLAEQVAQREANILDLEKQIKEEDAFLQKKKKEVENMIREEMKRSDVRDAELRTLKDAIAENAKLESQKESLLISKQKIEASIAAIKETKEKTEKNIEKHKKRRRRRELMLNDLKIKHEKIGKEIIDMRDGTKELEDQFERERSLVEKSKKEKKLLDKSIRAVDRDIEKSASDVLVRRGHLRNVETLLKGYAKTTQNRRNDQYRLEQERDQYEIACAEAERRYEDAKELVIVKQQETKELQDKIANGQERLKTQKQLLEQVTQERNTYSKNMMEAEREIKWIERNLKLMKTQITTCQADIKRKDDELAQAETDHSKFAEKNERYETDLANMRETIKKQEMEHRMLERQISKLNAIIREADAEVQKQRKEFEAVLNDRDILGAQLIRRNDELAQLYEKIKSQQSIVSKASVQYDQKMRDIEVMKEQISELRIKKANLEVKTRDLESLQVEVHRLQRTLVEEKQKLRALEDESETPLNVHPWTRIEGSDPWTRSMINRIQELQQLLISKTEQVLQKDLLIQEKEKLYLELRKMIARMPGVEANVQWEKYRKSLLGKQEQFETLKGKVRDTRVQIRQLRDSREEMLMRWEEIGNRYRNMKKEEKRLASRSTDMPEGL